MGKGDEFNNWPYGRKFQTYVYHGESVWYVSTATRKSSAMTHDCYYDETMVWKSNEKHERVGYFVFQTSGRHFDVCRVLSEHGSIEALEKWEESDDQR